jgi:hypothetical protein
MAVKLSALRTGRRFIPKKCYFSYSGINFCWRLSKPQSLVRPEGLGKLIKFIHLIEYRTHDLPASSLVAKLLRCQVLL